MGNTYTEGEEFAPQRSLFNALGFTKEEMQKPLVGIVSSYNEIVPGHMNTAPPASIPARRYRRTGWGYSACRWRPPQLGRGQWGPLCSSG